MSLNFGEAILEAERTVTSFLSSVACLNFEKNKSITPTTFFNFSYVIIWISSKNRLLHVRNNFEEEPDCPQSITKVVSVTNDSVPSLSIENQCWKQCHPNPDTLYSKMSKISVSKPLIGYLSIFLQARLKPNTNPFTKTQQLRDLY